MEIFWHLVYSNIELHLVNVFNFYIFIKCYNFYTFLNLCSFFHIYAVSLTIIILLFWSTKIVTRGFVIKLILNDGPGRLPVVLARAFIGQWVIYVSHVKYHEWEGSKSKLNFQLVNYKIFLLF